MERAWRRAPLAGGLLVLAGLALVGLRAGWSEADPAAFTSSWFGLELFSLGAGEARALCAAYGPGIAAPAGAPALAGTLAVLGWVHLVLALGLGAWRLPRWVARLLPPGTGLPSGLGGPLARVGAGLALLLATSPWMPHFVASRSADGAAAYLDLGDLAFGLGTGALLAGLLVWRRGAPAAAPPSAPGGVRLPLLAAVLVAALGPLLLSNIYLDGEPLTNDGVAYRWQAELFAEGRLEAPSTAADPFFGARQVLPPPGELGLTVFTTGPRPTWHGWTSKYPPGHSALLAPGTALGAPRLLPLALAGLCVLLTFHLAWRLGAGLEDARRRSLALASAWVLAASPMVLGVESLWLSHGTSLPAGLLFALCWLAAWARASHDEPGSPWPAALVAGFAISLCLAARPLTALALALPLALWTLGELVRRPAPPVAGAGGPGLDPGHPTEVLLARAPRWPVPRRPLAMLVALLGALPGLAAFAVVNARITGASLRPVYDLYAQLLSPNDAWGLVNLGTALEYTLYNLARLSPWLLGGPPALLVLAIGWWSLARGDGDRPSRSLRPRPGASLLALTWLVPLAFVALYALHRFQGIPWVGPLYLVESLPFLAVAAGAGVLAIGRGLGLGRPGLLFGPLLACSLALLHPHLARGAERSAVRRAPAAAAALELQRWTDAQADASGRLLVFVPVEGPGQAKLFPLPPPSFTAAPATASLVPGRWPVLARDLGPRNVDLWRLLDRPRAMVWSHARQRLEPLEFRPGAE